MSEYDSLSDKVINKRVAKALGYIPKNVYQNDVAVRIGGMNRDFCNNINDAWPICFEFGISLINIGATTAWLTCDDVRFETVCMSPDGNDNGVSCFDAKNSNHSTNPIRSAMITFLKMKDELDK
jgi:hypothetical protein